MTSILKTGCHELLPEVLKPFFTSKAFVPLDNTMPIPLWGAMLPPAAYYVALFLLSAPKAGPLSTAARYSMAAISAVSFFLLPFIFHVPGSAIFTYQLGLIGCFGSSRVLDIFFLSRPRVPRRIVVPQPSHLSKHSLRRPELGHEHEEQALFAMKGGRPVYPPGTDNLEWILVPHPTTVTGRLWWSLDLMISMRGIGWDFASADVRHDVSPWQPPSMRQIKASVFKILPAMLVSLLVTRALLDKLGGQPIDPLGLHTSPTIVELPPHLRPVLVLATGISLYSLFDAGYTLVSAVALPAFRRISTTQDTTLHNVDFFPLLNPMKLPQICSVRSFWSKAWHRLFHRSWLVFGMLPLQNLALLAFPVEGVDFLAPSQHPDPGRLLPKGTHDWAKVMGAFCASGFVHAVSERAALGGRLALPDNNFWLRAGWGPASTKPFLRSTQGLAGHEIGGKWSVSRLVPPFSGGGEFTFFFLNGVAVLVEGVFWAAVKKYRRRGAKVAVGGHDDRRKRAMKPASMASPHQQPPRGQSQSSSSSSAIESSSSPSSRLFGQSGLTVRPTLGTVTAPRRATWRGRDDSQDSTDMGDADEVERDLSDGGQEESDSSEGVKHAGPPRRAEANATGDDIDLPPLDQTVDRSYDRYVGLIWAVIVLLWTGEAFVSGWICSGVLAELTFYPH
ncbi:unnamed protein product [Jaminaea pallidilutea]